MNMYVHMQFPLVLVLVLMVGEEPEREQAMMRNERDVFSGMESNNRY